MGSASSGGGGGRSHSGSGASYMGGTGGGGTLRFEGGRVKGGDISDDKVQQAVKGILGYFRKRSDYVTKFVRTPSLPAAYGCIFQLVDVKKGRRTWTQVAGDMGITA